MQENLFKPLNSAGSWEFRCVCGISAFYDTAHCNPLVAAETDGWRRDKHKQWNCWACDKDWGN